MPSTEWSAPADAGNSAPFVQSTLSAAVLDISPGTYLIPAGALDAGTRLRIVAWGNYISASSTTTTLAFGFYLNNPGQTILTTPAALTLGPAITTVVGTMPWHLEFWGYVAVESTTTGTAGQINGRGRFSYTTASWTATYTTAITPLTAAGTTAAVQTATGLITYNEQNLFVGCTLGVTATGMTSITTDELTCELIG